MAGCVVCRGVEDMLILCCAWSSRSALRYGELKPTTVIVVDQLEG
jgi:hypothetical protein